MSARITLFLLIAASIPVWSQVEPSATGADANTLDDTQMMMPAPTSGIPYPNQSTTDARSNYLGAGLAVRGAYIDNILPGGTATPVNDFNYSILPTVSLQSTTTRQGARANYSPSFIFYKNTNSLDTVDQNASAVYQYRISPEVAFSLQDYFARTSNVFDQSSFFSGVGASGSTQLPISVVIAPFAEQLTNELSGNLGYQFGRNGMVGVGGSEAIYDLPNGAQAAGLYKSHSEGAMAYYSRRLSRSQYAGFVYEYDRVSELPTTGHVEIQEHSFLPYYTFYFSRAFSISLSGGAARVDIAQSSSPDTNSWAPSGVASLGWQGTRGSFSGSYKRTVSAGGGLLGAYNTNSVSATGGWELATTWFGNVAFSF